jgi:hypothetical protein
MLPSTDYGGIRGSGNPAVWVSSFAARPNQRCQIAQRPPGQADLKRSFSANRATTQSTTRHQVSQNSQHLPAAGGYAWSVILGEIVRTG